ncbi:uncharacterized protein METZ01_LOCUS463410, partial [marine metagenome]
RWSTWHSCGRATRVAGRSDVRLVVARCTTWPSRAPSPWSFRHRNRVPTACWSTARDGSWATARSPRWSSSEGCSTGRRPRPRGTGCTA